MNAMTRPLALLAGLGLALGAASYAPPASAHTDVVVGVRVAPPPPRHVRVPPPRPGFVWAPGYWRWDPFAHRHVWVDGYWIRARPGYRYAPAHWVRRGPEWRFAPGYWVR